MLILSLVCLGFQDHPFESDLSFGYLAAGPGPRAVAITRQGCLYLFDGAGLHKVADSVDAWGASLSPDGEKIAFRRDGRIEALSLSGKRIYASQDFGHCGFPTWISAGELGFVGDGVLFAGKKSFPGFGDVATLSFNPAKALFAYCDMEGKLLVFDPATGGKRTLFSDPDSLSLFAPAWSPGGERILVNRLGQGFWIGEPDENKWKLVSPGEAPSWSPDGKRVVYQVTRDDGHRILSSDLLMLDVATGETRLIDRNTNKISPVFGGEVIYYLTTDGQIGYLSPEK